MAIDGVGTILGTTIAINLGKSEQDIDRLKQKIKELKTAIDSLSTGKVNVVMLDGVKTSIDDLNKKLKELQVNIKGLENVKLPKVADGNTKDIDDAAAKLQTWKQRLTEVQKKMAETHKLSGSHAAQALHSADENEAYRKVQEYQAILTKARDAEVKAEEKKAQRLSDIKAKQNADAEKQRIKDEEASRNKRTSELEEQAKQAQYISNLKAQQNADSDRQRIKDEDAARNRRTAQLKDQMSRPAEVGDYGKLVAQIRQVNTEALNLATTMNRTKLPADVTAFREKQVLLQNLNSELNRVNQSMGITNNQMNLMGTFAQKMKGHFTWILAGTFLAALGAIPVAIQNIAMETEVMGSKIKQNLELAKQYHGNMQGLDADIKHLTEVASVFSIGYGVNLHDTMEMMQVLSRRFKSPEELTYYTNLAMVLHKLDFVAPKVAAETLESVILSMGLNFKQAKQMVDEFSVAVHSSRIVGTELLTGLTRAGATMKTMNFTTAEAISLIATMSTVTAKAGANIGASLNSVLINTNFKKAQEALNAYNVEVYKVVDGHKQMRGGVEIWQDIAKVFNGLADDDKANEFADRMSGGKYRANDLRALLDNWETFKEILGEIKEKASPELTAELLKTGMQTYETDVKRLSASLQVLGMTMGQETLPALKAVTQGLTAGVMWLNDHRVEVGKLIKEVSAMAAMFLFWRKAILLGGIELATLNGTMKVSAILGQALAGNFTAIGTSAKAMGLAIGTATLQLALLYAAAQVAFAMYDHYKNKTPEQRELESEIANLSSALTDPFITAETAERIEANITAKEAKLKEIIKKKALESTPGDVNEYLEKARKLAEEAEKNMPAPKIPETPEFVAGQSLGGDKGKNGGGIVPLDGIGKLERDAYKDAIALAMHKAKMATEEYNASLEVLNNTESIYGKTVENTSQKLDLMQKRWRTFNDQEWSSNSMAETLEKDLDEKIGASGDLLGQLGMPSQEAWNSLGKIQKAELKLLKRDILETHADIQAETKAYYTWLEDAAKNHTDKVKMEADIQKMILQDSKDPSKIYNRALSNNANTAAYELTQVDKYRLDSPNTKRNIEKNKLQADQVAHKAFLKHEEDQVLKAQEGLNKARTEEEKKFYEVQLQLALDNANKQRTVVAQTAQALKEIDDEKTLGVRENMQSITHDVLLEGKSLKSVWGSLWKGLADDALKQLFRVQNGSSSILGTLLSVFGAATGRPTVNGKTVEGPLRQNGTFASGGLVNQPTNALIGETYEEETVINLDKLRKGDTRQHGLLAYANSKTDGGIGVGTNVVASVSDRTMQNAQSASLQSSANARHIAELEHANSLMIRQNQMMLSLVQNQGKNTGNTTIVTTAVSAEQVLGVLQSNPDALANILGRHKSSGFR